MFGESSWELGIMVVKERKQFYAYLILFILWIRRTKATSWGPKELMYLCGTGGNGIEIDRQITQSLLNFPVQLASGWNPIAYLLSLF